MDKIERARVIIEDKMLKNDPFSQWLGIEIVSFDDQHCELSLLIRPEMCNGFGVAHGGITYSLADSALAFASNADGIKIFVYTMYATLAWQFKVFLRSRI